jgi:hypothetical protein
LDEAPVGTAEWGEQRIETYLAFSAWEAENPDLVAELREQAEASVE